MIDQFLIFNPTGIVTFNYQPGKNLTKVTNAFIQDILISERKMKPVDGSEFNKTQSLNSTDSAAAAEEAEANEALITKENDNEKGDEEDEDNVSGNDHSIEDEDLVVETDISLGTYSYEGYNLKYLIWSKEKTKVYFTMVYPSLITIKKPYEFLKNIKILYENSENDLNKFEKFFEIKLKDLTQDAPINKGAEEEEKEANNNYNNTNISTSSINEKKESKKKPSTEKKGRKWNADGSFYEESSSGKGLDFSVGDKNNEKNKNIGSSNLEQLVGNKSKFGTKTSDGEFIVSDLSEEMTKIFTTSKKKSIINSQNDKSGSAFGFLRNIIGGKKITKDDIQKIKSALSQHLIEKNVAPNVANSLISEIEKELVGSTTDSFTSIEETAKQSLSRQLVKLLTPNSSIDLLHEIQLKKSQNIPYVISVVGVNGVGKSTNLSKLAYWFLQNNYRVLITACDTFRSGAVEQLRTHVNNLVKLSPNKRQIELFESGYGGADLVAKIATGAIKYAKENKFDIVLMDTAGRRHNDSQLMAPLVSFAKAANPDKIIMVGEALVGTDSVLQAQNFNKAFGGNRHLDFFIVSKCDTVGDLIGSMVNMVYATGIPILFVGTGQTYTDLRTLSVDWAVNMLMS